MSAATAGFTLDEIERAIEAPTGEIDEMCLALVAKAIDDEEYSEVAENTRGVLAADLGQLGARRRQPLWPARSVVRRTRAGEAARIQRRHSNLDRSRGASEWGWLEQSIERRIVPKDADQFNSIHERLIEGWKKLGSGRHLHLTGTTGNGEDLGTLTYLDIMTQAGLSTTLIDIEDIGWRDGGGFVDLDNRDIAFAFKLYPWEWMFADAFGARLIEAPTR